jgi:membrane protein
MNAQSLLELLKLAFADWNEDKAPRLAAALSYFTVFSIAPLLVIIISIIGLVYGQKETTDQISNQISGVVGEQAAEFIESMVQSASKPRDSIVATVIGFVTLLFGAMGVFGQLQDALNTIWEVQPDPNLSLLDKIKARFSPFVMLLGIAFLLLCSLALSAGIAAAGEWMGGVLPLPEFVLQALNIGLGFCVITVMFAAIFKFLPDVEIRWHDVWIGAAFTAFLFLVGQIGLSLYVGKVAADSTYGAAGSLVAVLLWVFWTSQILFFGAELTQVYANKYGSHLRPAEDAVPMTEQARAQQGLTRDSQSHPTAINNSGEKNEAPTYRNLLAETRREEDFKTARRKNAQSEMLEDVGAILAGLGIVLILKNLFSRKNKN